MRLKTIFDTASCPRYLIESWNLLILFLLILFRNSVTADDAESVYFMIKTTVETVNPKTIGVVTSKAFVSEMINDKLLYRAKSEMQKSIAIDENSLRNCVLFT